MTTAAVMTYDSLAADVSSYLERTDDATLAKIPTFVMLAEQVLTAELKFLGTLTVNTSKLNISGAVLDKPARWRKTVSMNITDATGTRYPMLLRKYEYLREYWPDSTLTDLPKFYCDYDYTHWLITPPPDAAYDFEVLYYERPQPLDSSNQSNWFTQYAPQALLYGSLLQAMPFLKNDGRIAMWQQQYQLIVTALKNEDVTRLGDRQSLAVDS